MAHVLKKPVDGEYEYIVLSNHQMEDVMTYTYTVFEYRNRKQDGRTKSGWIDFGPTGRFGAKIFDSKNRIIASVDGGHFGGSPDRGEIEALAACMVHGLNHNHYWKGLTHPDNNTAA